jgi:hypothetical protein
MKAIEQTEMLEHCIRKIQKHPYQKEIIFLQLLYKFTESEYKRIVEQFKYIDKTL